MVRKKQSANKVRRKPRPLSPPPIPPIATAPQLDALHQHTSALVEGIRRYEEMARVFGYAATVSAALALQRVGIPVLAVEQVLTEIGFDGESLVPVGTFSNEGNAFEVLMLLYTTLQCARVSRHADTPEQREDAIQGWAKIANGGWGWMAGELLPQLHELLPPLELVVRRLRELVQPPTLPVETTTPPETPVQTPITHGVIPPDSFRWNGITVKGLSSAQYRMLSCLSEGGQLRTVPIPTVAAVVYSGNPQPPEDEERALAQMCRRIWGKIEKAGVPIELSIVNGHVRAAEINV